MAGGRDIYRNLYEIEIGGGINFMDVIHDGTLQKQINDESSENARSLGLDHKQLLEQALFTELFEYTQGNSVEDVLKSEQFRENLLDLTPRNSPALIGYNGEEADPRYHRASWIVSGIMHRLDVKLFRDVKRADQSATKEICSNILDDMELMHRDLSKANKIFMDVIDTFGVDNLVLILTNKSLFCLLYWYLQACFTRDTTTPTEREEVHFLMASLNSIINGCIKFFKDMGPRVTNISMLMLQMMPRDTSKSTGKNIHNKFKQVSRKVSETKLFSYF